MATDVEVTRRRFTVDEYHRMGEAGILNEDDRVELIRGEIVQMSPIGGDHASCVARLTHILLGRLHGRVVLWPQNPLVILPDSEPQPDIILLAWRGDFYRDPLPGPADVALLIEVADTSLRYDRRVKGALYAEAGVREYWIVDLGGDAIEVYRDPAATGYARTEGVGRGAVLTPVAFADVTLAAADILG
ncbi:MAG TPA: Uma2 family endonuclease [Methylomirabilota bacterium]